MNFSGILSQINFSNPTWDLFIMVFFAVSAVLYGLSMGRDRIVVMLVSIYMAIVVVDRAPFLKSYADSLPIDNGFALKVAAFVGAFLIVFFLLARSGLMHSLGSNDSSGRWWQVIVFSFLHVGLLISIVLSYLPPEISNNLAFITRAVFLSDSIRFTWTVMPILVMVLVHEKKK